MHKNPYQIEIPNPCSEDWEQMTPKDRGRFCSSCSKVVVDFTQMTPTEIQTYFKENWGKSICGHFRKSQLGAHGVQIYIPQDGLFQYKNVRQMMLWAFFVCMGTTLFSCKNEQGQKVNIDKIEIVNQRDTIKIEQDSLANTNITCTDSKEKIKDSLQIPEIDTLEGEVEIKEKHQPPPLPDTTTGIVGVSEVPKDSLENKTKIDSIHLPVITGKIALPSKIKKDSIKPENP